MNLGARLNVDLDLSFQNQNSLVPCEHIRARRSSKVVFIHTPERHLQVRLIADPEYTAEQRSSAYIVGLGRCLARGPLPSILFAHTILPLSASLHEEFGTLPISHNRHFILARILRLARSRRRGEGGGRPHAHGRARAFSGRVSPEPVLPTEQAPPRWSLQGPADGETAHGPPRACCGSPAVNATHAEQAAERALLKPLAGDRMEDDHDDEEGQSDRWAKEPHDGHRKAVERHADHRAQALGTEVLRRGGPLQQFLVVT